MAVNKVILLGRLGKDPELKYLESGSLSKREQNMKHFLTLWIQLKMKLLKLQQTVKLLWAPIGMQDS